MQSSEDVQARREILQMNGVEEVQKTAEFSLKLAETLFVPPNLLSPGQLSINTLTSSQFLRLG